MVEDYHQGLPHPYRSESADGTLTLEYTGLQEAPLQVMAPVGGVLDEDGLEWRHRPAVEPDHHRLGAGVDVAEVDALGRQSRLERVVVVTFVLQPEVPQDG